MRMGLALLGLVTVACGASPRVAPDVVATTPSAPSREAAPGSARVTVSIETPTGTVEIDAELADTPHQRAQGLMYRASLESGKGMFFIHDDRTVRSFWMKNTLIPLDMVFIDGPPDVPTATVIGIVHEAEPRTLTPRSVGEPGRYVLEVPGGWARKSGISKGARASWLLPD